MHVPDNPESMRYINWLIALYNQDAKGQQSNKPLKSAADVAQTAKSEDQ